jgi:hypothetical protein
MTFCEGAWGKEQQMLDIFKQFLLLLLAKDRVAEAHHFGGAGFVTRFGCDTDGSEAPTLMSNTDIFKKKIKPFDISYCHLQQFMLYRIRRTKRLYICFLFSLQTIILNRASGRSFGHLRQIVAG